MGSDPTVHQDCTKKCGDDTDCGANAGCMTTDGLCDCTDYAIYFSPSGNPTKNKDCTAKCKDDTDCGTDAYCDQGSVCDCDGGKYSPSGNPTKNKDCKAKEVCSSDETSCGKYADCAPTTAGPISCACKPGRYFSPSGNPTKNKDCTGKCEYDTDCFSGISYNARCVKATDALHGVCECNAGRYSPSGHPRIEKDCKANEVCSSDEASCGANADCSSTEGPILCACKTDFFSPSGDPTKNKDCTAVNPFKSEECWDFDKAAGSCTMKKECTTVTCGAESMDVAVKSKLFGLDTQEADKVAPKPDVDASDANGFNFKKSCKLGECEMTYKIVDSKLEFTMILREAEQDGFTNTVDTAKNALMVNQNPLAVAVKFTCKYPVAIELTSEPFNLKDVVLGSGPSNEGSLATGFELALDAGVTDAIKLGDRQEVKATWKVTGLKDVTFNFTECTVTQGTTEIALVKNSCFSNALKVATKEGSAMEQAFSYTTFSTVGATSTSQTMKCTITICMDDCKLPKEDKECLAADETDFGAYDFTVAGYTSGETQGGGDAGDDAGDANSNAGNDKCANCDGTKGMCTSALRNSVVIDGKNYCCYSDDEGTCKGYISNSRNEDYAECTDGDGCETCLTGTWRVHLHL